MKKRGNIRSAGFLISLLFIIILSILSLKVLKNNQYILDKFNIALFIAVASLSGVLYNWLTKNSSFAVFIHEAKHALFAGLVGNKGKKIIIHKNGGGEYLYQYNKDTASFNSIIALAPYWFPLYTIPAFIIALLLLEHRPFLAIFLTAMAYGADFIANMRDISPYQTDFSNLFGGFLFGIIYVISMNLIIIIILIMWAGLGIYGIKLYFQQMILLIINLIVHIRNITIKQ